MEGAYHMQMWCRLPRMPCKQRRQIALVTDHGGSTPAVVGMSVKYLNSRADLLPHTKLEIEYVEPNVVSFNRGGACQALAEDTYGILTLSSGCSYIKEVAQQTKEFGIPHFTTNRNYCLKYLQESNGTISSKYRTTDVTRAIRDISKQKKIHATSIIYDDSKGKDEILFLCEKMIKGKYGQPMSLELNRTLAGNVKRQVTTAFEIWTRARHLFPHWLFILLLKPNTAKEVLSVAEERGMLNAKYTWFVLWDGWTKEQYESVLPEGAMITLIRRKLGKSLTTQLEEMVRSEMPQRKQLTPEEVYLTASVFAWASALDELFRNDVISDGMQAVDSSCVLTLAWKNRVNSTLVDAVEEKMTEYEVKPSSLEYTLRTTFPMRTRQGLLAVFISSGSWNVTSGLDLREKDYFSRRHLLVGIVPYQPFISFKIGADGKAYNKNGLLFEVLRELKEKLGFTYRIIQPADRQYGVLLENGTWTGLVGQVLRGEVDFVIAPVDITPERQQVVEYSIPFFIDSMSLLIRRPTTATSVFFYKDPFKDEVWITLLLTVFLVAIFLYYINSKSPFYDHVKDVKRNQGLFRFSNCLWYTYGAIVQQGGTHLPDSLSGRLLVGFYWLFVLVTVATYSGNLIAFLTFPKIVAPIQTLQELVNQDTVNWVIKRGTSFTMYLQNSPKPVYQNLYVGLKSETRGRYVDSLAEAIAMVKSGRFVYLDTITHFLTAIEKDLNTTLSENPRTVNPCQLSVAKDAFLAVSYGFIYRKGSPYKQKIDQILSVKLEHGFLTHWQQQYWPKPNLCSSSARVEQAKIRNVSLDQLQGAFWTLLCGCGIALICTIVECRLHRYKNKKNIVEKLQKENPKRIAESPTVKIYSLTNPRESDIIFPRFKSKEKDRLEQDHRLFSRFSAAYPTRRSRSLARTDEGERKRSSSSDEGSRSRFFYTTWDPHYIIPRN